MKHHMRAFSIGLFTSAIILLIVFYLAHDPEVTLEDVDPENMIPILEDQGYAVLSQQEYIAFSVSDEEEGNNSENDESEEDNEQNSEEESNEDEEQNNDDENSNEEESSNDEEASEESSVVEYSLTVETGMASSEISDILESEDIIDNASDFTDYLEDNDYSISIKPGTFELSSDMSHYEIAEAITSFN